MVTGAENGPNGAATAITGGLEKVRYLYTEGGSVCQRTGRNEQL